MRSNIADTTRESEPEESILKSQSHYEFHDVPHAASVIAYRVLQHGEFADIHLSTHTPNRAESLRHVNTYHNACRPRSHAHHAALSRAGGLYKRLLMWHWDERDAVNDLLQPCWAARAQQGPLDR